MGLSKLLRTPGLLYANVRGFVPLASGFLCGGVGLIPIFTVLPISCCSATYGWEIVLKSGPVPPVGIAFIGAIGLGAGAISLSGQRIRRYLKHDVWCGLMMVTLGIAMTGASGLLIRWVFGRGSWQTFALIVGAYGLFNLFLMLGLGITMILLGYRIWRSRKTRGFCADNQATRVM